MAISFRRKKEIYAAHLSGAKVSEIISRFGVSRNTVYKVIDKFAGEDNIDDIQPNYGMSKCKREKYLAQIADQTILGLVDYSDLILRRVKYISALPQNQISNADLSTLHHILKGLAELELTDKKADGLLETLQAYLFSLRKE